MSRELDVRERRATPRGFDGIRDRETDLRQRAATLSQALPGSAGLEVADVNPETGTANRIQAIDWQDQGENFVQRAVSFVQRSSSAIGITDEQGSAEFIPDPNYQQTSEGAIAVNVRQAHQGIPIFEATRTVRFAPDGLVEDSVGRSEPLPFETRRIAPDLTVTDAVGVAAEHVATPDEDEREAVDQFGEPVRPTSVGLEGFVPTVIATFDELPSRPTVLERGPFEEAIKASLVWFPIGGEYHLAWRVTTTMPGHSEQFLTLVDAMAGEILYCKETTSSVAARGNVFSMDGGGARQDTQFPVSLDGYPTDFYTRPPSDFPGDWVGGRQTADGRYRTVGNNVEAIHVQHGPAESVTQGEPPVFDTSDPHSDYQEVVNTFYYCNLMHDFFYLLGFREADGAFQQINFDAAGMGGDRVTAEVYPGYVNKTANMYTPVDGRGPTMKLGRVTSTGRHTGLDSTVVFHEYTHGVTNRLIGGPGNDEATLGDQSAGMDEGYCDYFACTFTGSDVVGAWIKDDPGGIRSHPYNRDFDRGFDDVGRVRFPHGVGEIWCAALMELNRIIGRELALQLVVDSLKLIPANPTMLQARDGILKAVDGMESTGTLSRPIAYATRRGIWSAFGRHGMGAFAWSPDASLTRVDPYYGDAAPPSAHPRHVSDESAVTGRIVGIAATDTGDGFWRADENAGIYVHGDAPFYGWLGGVPLDAPIVDVVASTSGDGYWLTGADGSVYVFEREWSYRWEPPEPVDGTAVGLEPTASGNGFWLATDTGAVYSVGDAPELGPPNGHVPPGTIVDIAATADRTGYRLAARDGSVYSFNAPPTDGVSASGVIAMEGIPGVQGFLLARTDGTVHHFDGQSFQELPAPSPLDSQIVGLAVSPTSAGYWLASENGLVHPQHDVRGLASRPIGLNQIDVSWFGEPDVSDERLDVLRPAEPPTR